MFNIPPLSSDIFAVNFDAPASPSFNYNLSDAYSGSHAFGWGLAWYPGKQQSAMVIKDPAVRVGQILTDAIADWSNFRSTIFFSKVRGADSGYSQTETQPFSKSFAGRDWLFMHNGDLDQEALEQLHGRQKRLMEPIGGTDSELAFCDLLTQLQENGDRQLSEIDPLVLHEWFIRFDQLGSADMFLSDGQSIACFQSSKSPKQLNYARLQPPSREEVYESAAARISINDPRDTFRTAFVISSSPFSSGEWTSMQPNQLIIANHGAIVWNSAPDQSQPFIVNAPPLPLQSQFDIKPLESVQAEQTQAKQQAEAPPHILVTNIKSVTQTPEGKSLSYRMYEVSHTTHYEYTKPVEHSTHLFRLQPTEDSIQSVAYSNLVISSPSEEIIFDDVFGNQSVHCTINKPYQKLSVATTSRVKIYESPPDDHSLSRRQTSIPLVWMPWQRQMMMPYLLPQELPEPQLYELTDYAMSFVERNDYHLIRTVNDINLSIYRDYKYVPGSTSLNTTPFEVYSSREGVCQDFANLFICLTRLLSIPARYRMGYIYTGANYENKIQSDASHAWAEVYLPYIGWRGFDPTNGCAVAQDHVRVACGRNYIDATPTSGTIYKGGGDETLSVEVKMHEISE